MKEKIFEVKSDNKEKEQSIEAEEKAMTDEELLKRFSILRVDRHPEKIAEFKIKKHEIENQFSGLHNEIFEKLASLPPEEIKIALENMIKSLTEDLSRYMAMSELLNEEAVDNARICLSLKNPPPEKPKPKVNLRIVK